ncbi:MAG: hypothetical protein H6959_09705 [Chromatiaceae bacterium]|nr:hypothetical protein [Gammaproteobacteria bacterium]MCP5298280.1 hypothetical protein [Chromatiaceae bacterium]MCP5423180.1 hypothetical protein [Chromatiaceae bacterium]
MAPSLPTATAFALLACLLSGCADDAPPAKTAEPKSNVYLEAVQNAEAARYQVEQHNLEEKRIDELLGRGNPQSPR